MSGENASAKARIETVLVCYTQAVFDQLAADPAHPPQADEEPDEEVSRARYLAHLAEAITAALGAAGRTAEIVRVPQRSFAPKDISKAAFAWRILDLKESNGRSIDLVLCLDFPAWSLVHPHKCTWLTGLPNFVVRAKSGLAYPATAPGEETSPHQTSRIQRNDDQAERAKNVAALLQAERRGLAEARRVLAGSRDVAEELARRGLQVEFNPLPPDLSVSPSDPLWQTALKRLLGET